MGTKGINLLEAFQAVSQVMGQNQTALNEADDYNHNHGDNMAEIFQVIAQAMEEKKDAEPADQLAYASELLRRQTQSGSAQVYTQGLSDAAQMIQGQQLSAENLFPLIQTILGGGQTAQPKPAAPPASSSLFGSLLSGLFGGGKPQPSQAQSGLDAGDLLQMGMAFLQSRQGSEGDAGALIDAIMAGSQMSSSPHREQSGKLVVDTLLQTLGPMLGQ